MNTFRFSPIKNKTELLHAVSYTHFACHTICKEVIGHYLPVAGNIGIFCHFDEEYVFLTNMRKEMTVEADNWNQKYYRLHEPIVIPAKDDVPESTYTYLYIRKPDPEHTDVGDVDFYLEQPEYSELKSSLAAGKKIKGASIFDRPDLDLVRLSNPSVDAVAFAGPHKML